MLSQRNRLRARRPARVVVAEPVLQLERVLRRRALHRRRSRRLLARLGLVPDAGRD